jgi:hypothetical protein
LPPQAGGKAVKREDFNGAFNLLGGIAFMAQKGFTFNFDATQDYYAGCVVIDTTDGQKYECIADVAAGGSAPSADSTHWQLAGNNGVDIDIWFRQANTQYGNGAITLLPTLPTGWYLECTGTGGITSADDLVITSPTVGATVTDGAVVWTIRSISAEATTTDKGLLSPSDKAKINNIPASGGTGFNHREVITTSGTWTAPTSGYYRVTCIGGGGAGGSNGFRGGYGGRTTSFGSHLSAIGGGGGGGAARTNNSWGSGGGGAGKVATGYVKLIAGNSITCTVGVGGTASTVDNTAPTGTDAGVNQNYYSTNSSAYGAHGAGNGCPGFYDSGGWGGFGGLGGSNGTGCGGGGGGACGGNYGWRAGGGGNGSDNGSNGSRPTANGGTVQLDGGNGGDGAIIIEYYLNA